MLAMDALEGIISHLRLNDICGNTNPQPLTTIATGDMRPVNYWPKIGDEQRMVLSEDAVEFMRCLNAICGGGDARCRQVTASYYYGEIAEQGVGPVLKEQSTIIDMRHPFFATQPKIKSLLKKNWKIFERAVKTCS